MELLGFKKVGWVFSQPNKERDYILSSEEVRQAAAIQVGAQECVCGGGGGGEEGSKKGSSSHKALSYLRSRLPHAASAPIKHAQMATFPCSSHPPCPPSTSSPCLLPLPSCCPLPPTQAELGPSSATVVVSWDSQDEGTGHVHFEAFQVHTNICVIVWSSGLLGA